jgi:tricorn protease
MKKSILFLPLLFIVLSLTAQITPQWLRSAAISPNGQKIAFTFKGDLYIIPAIGGTAQPITFHEAHDFMPVWSRDGKHIAFASDRYGNFDVYLIAAEGGEAKRLTFHSSNEYPYAFNDNDQSIIFGGVRMDAAQHRQYATGSQPEVYKIAVNGGRVKQVLTTPAEDIKLSRDGQIMIYHDKKGGENDWRKHHQSSVTRDIWMMDTKSGKHTMVTSFKGEDRNPVFSEDENSIYYLSEESGSFNVHKLLLADSKQKEQVTKFNLHPVRYLSISANGILCYSYDGELYTQKIGSSPQKLSVKIFSENKSNNDRIVPVNGNVREMAVSPNGKEVAYIVRGEIFVSSVEGGVTKRITNTAEQERFISYAPDGNSLLFARETNSGWKIIQAKKSRREELYFYASTVITEEALIDNKNENYEPLFSPDGKEIAFIENRATLKVYNIAARNTRTLLTPDELFYMADGDQYFTWSPDSKWLLAEYSPIMSNGEVVLIAADGKSKMINLTESGYTDFRPKWVNGGKQLLWFSDRDGLRSYANSGTRQADVYSMFFTQDGWDKFRLSKEDYALQKEMDEKAAKEKKDSTAKKDSSIKFDWDGLKDRKTRLTIHSSALGDATLSKDGEKLYYLARFEKGMNLWSTNLRTKETKQAMALNSGSGSLQWDKEMKNLFLLADGRISKIDPETGKQESIGISSEMGLDAVAERKQMFEHVWRRTDEMFYISTMHGAPWKKLKSEYEKYLPSVGNGYEFTELLSEMLGELNVSHSGARYSNPFTNGDITASLGIFFDYDYTGNGLKIAEVINGGPLDKAGLNIASGMIIEQVDGETISADKDYTQYLNRKAGKFTLLQIFDPVKNERKTITIKPITNGEENGLLYKRWVKHNRDEVDKLSNGQLGYVHLPGMADGPYRNTYEDVMGKYHNRKGIIIDTRFNGGGDLVGDLAMFLTGKKFLEYNNEKRAVGYEPNFRWTKPSVSLVNEANYSDGHCYACGYQDLGIGKMIGQPVPGTCSFSSWETLQDGQTVWGAVPVSTKNSKGQWLENLETVPEFIIKNEPAVISKGKDQQLEKAVEVLLKEIK